jgi:transposase
MKLSATDYSLLRELQQNEKHKRNYVKITVLLMLHLGKSAEEIGLCLGISAATVSNYEKKYEQLGLDSYLEDNYVAYQGKLTPEEQALVVQELSENLYQNTAQMVDFISERFGKKYTCQGVVPWLHRLGFSYKKTKLVFCQADLSQQVALVDRLNTLKARLESDSAELYFADALHPPHHTRSSYAWIPKGQEKEVPSVSGRQRLNCKGAINPSEVRDMELRFDTCINAQSTWLLYKQLAEKHSDKACIYVVCENARYYKNKQRQGMPCLYYKSSCRVAR